MSFIQLAPELLGLDDIENYIEDDWGDDSLTNRSNTSDGVYAAPSANKAGEVLIGRYRPEWNITFSAPNSSVSVSNGEVSISQSDNDTSIITTPTQIHTGEWSADIYVDGEGDEYTGADFAIIVETDGSSGRGSQLDNSVYISSRNTSGSLNDSLIEQDNGAVTKLVDFGDNSDAGYDTYSVTRDSFGNYEAFRNGSSKGTTSSSYLPKPNYTSLMAAKSTNVSHTVKFDNLVIK